MLDSKNTSDDLVKHESLKVTSGLQTCPQTLWKMINPEGNKKRESSAESPTTPTLKETFKSEQNTLGLHRNHSHIIEIDRDIETS